MPPTGQVQLLIDQKTRADDEVLARLRKFGRPFFPRYRPPKTDCDASGHKGVARSVQLLTAFRHEQSDPTAFYRLLANDAVREISRYCQLAGARVLDIGGGSGYVGEAISDAGARTLTVEHAWEQIVEHGRHLKRGIQADGCRLPLGDEAFDVAYSSNVLEHVAEPEAILEEMIRVVCPGGIVFVTFTNWFSPWGGHETSPWHYLGGEWAARHYERRHRHAAKNRYGTSLFPLHIGRVLAWAQSRSEIDVLDAFPRYYPRWTRPLVRVPGLREIFTWNLALVMRRRGADPLPELTGVAGAQRVVGTSPVSLLVRSLASSVTAMAEELQPTTHQGTP